MKENKILSFLHRNEYEVIRQLKVHQDKRYTYEVVLENKKFIAKFHTKCYLAQQHAIHFGIDILAKPSSDILQNQGIVQQNHIFTKKIDDVFFSLYDFIDGSSLEELIQSNEEQLILEQLDTISILFKKFSEIQKQNSSFGPISKDSKTFSAWHSFLTQYFSEKIEKCYARKLIDPTEKKLLYNLLSQKSRFINKSNIVHYDLSISNIILNQMNELVVIDWDGYYIGDFVYSVAKFLYYLHTNEFYKFYSALMNEMVLLFGEKSINDYLLFIIIEKMPVIFDNNYKNRLQNDWNLFHETIKKFN